MESWWYRNLMNSATTKGSAGTYRRPSGSAPSRQIGDRMSSSISTANADATHSSSKRLGVLEGTSNLQDARAGIRRAATWLAVTVLTALAGCAPLDQRGSLSMSAIPEDPYANHSAGPSVLAARQPTNARASAATTPSQTGAVVRGQSPPAHQPAGNYGGAATTQYNTPYNTAPYNTTQNAPAQYGASASAGIVFLSRRYMNR